MSDSQKSSKTKVKPEAVKPMAALQGYLDDMLAVATTTAAVQETVVLQETVGVQETEISEPEVKVETQTIEHVESVVETVAEPVIETYTPEEPDFEHVTETMVETAPVITESPVIAVPDIEIPDVIVSESAVPEPEIATEEPELEEETTETPIQVADDPTSFQQQLSQKALSPEGVELAYPQWAASGFECLLFYVGGIKLAVPLILLGGIHRIDKELTPLFGQPEWFLGLYPKPTMDGQQNIRVVHTAKWVMPEKQCPEVDPINHYVISLGDSEWGLLSHQLSDSIRLTPDQVKWRTSAGKRPWLAGTVIDHMCAILDVNRLVDLLNQNSQRLS